LPRHTRVHLGVEAVVEITGLRTPCSKVNDYRAGLQALLWGPRGKNGERERRAGVMAVVITGGEVLPGSGVTIDLPPELHLPLGPV
jgi:MOSC domain-containing protein YiiM